MMDFGKRARRAASTDQQGFAQRGNKSYDPHDPSLRDVPRNHNIFPGGFGTSDQSKVPSVEFTLGHLEDILIKQHTPNDHVEPVYVTSAQYCKERDGSQHEFIILTVETEEQPKLKNFIILDRANSSQGERIERDFMPLISASLYSSKPRDRFRVAYDGTLKNLLVHCKLSKHAVLETLEFQSKSFPFYEMVALSRAASGTHQGQSLPSNPCQWFTSLVWDCIRQLLPNVIYNQVISNAESNSRGKSGYFFRQRLDFKELNTISSAVNQELHLIRQDFIYFHREQEWHKQLRQELNVLKEDKPRRETM